jgi:hypothetical protein
MGPPVTGLSKEPHRNNHAYQNSPMKGKHTTKAFNKKSNVRVKIICRRKFGTVPCCQYESAKHEEKIDA